MCSSKGSTSTFKIQRTLFYSNNALYGGGLSVFIDYIERSNFYFNTIIVEDCVNFVATKLLVELL